MDDELLPWLRAQIAATRKEADTRHTLTCNLVLGSITGNHDDECDCGHPAAVLAQCEAHTAILDAHPHVTRPEMPGDWCTREGCCACDFRDGVQAYYGHCDTVIAVALAYQHNPGYNEDWRP